VRHRGDEPRAVAAVVAHAVDLELVRRGVRVDLEVHGPALRDADLGREALDAGIAHPGDVPLVLRRAREAVLGLDLVAGDGARGVGARGHGREAGERDGRGGRGDGQSQPIPAGTGAGQL
jgi:hypothetical protein